MGEIALSGSCLCGSVAYELEGDARRFYHCHCERCRKASGSAHASNIILRLKSITWTAGESLVHSYKLPEAERFDLASENWIHVLAHSLGVARDDDYAAWRRSGDPESVIAAAADRIDSSPFDRATIERVVRTHFGG